MTGYGPYFFFLPFSPNVPISLVYTVEEMNSNKGTSFLQSKFVAPNKYYLHTDSASILKTDIFTVAPSSQACLKASV